MTYSDSGTVLPAEAVALVYDPAKDDPWTLLIPESYDNNREIVPEGVVLLACFLARITHDPEFVIDMMRWFLANSKN